MAGNGAVGTGAIGSGLVMVSTRAARSTAEGRSRASPRSSQNLSSEAWASLTVVSSGSVRHQRCAAVWLDFSTTPLRLPRRGGRAQALGSRGQHDQPHHEQPDQEQRQGRQPVDADVPKITAPLLLQYGGLDERINAGIPAFEAALKANNKFYELYVYEGANHAFNNDTNAARYNKDVAELAWSRTVEFLKKYVA